MIPEKYRVLLIFMLFTLNNGFAWLMFDPIADELEGGVKGMSVGQLEVLSSWQPLMFILMFFPIMKMIAHPGGLQKAIRLGTVCELAGAIFKVIGALARGSSAGVYFFHVGQIFSGVGSPVATGCVSTLSATWFDPEERTRATALAVLSNSAGNALCYLFVPAMTAAAGLVSVTLYETAMGAISVVLAWWIFPQVTESVFECRALATPTEAPWMEEGGGEEEWEAKPLSRQLRQLFGNLSSVFLLLIYSWSSGGFSAWISLFDETYHSFFSAKFIGDMSFFGVVAYVTGGLFSSHLTDLYFRRRMKQVIFFCVLCNSLSNIVFLTVAPNNEGHALWAVDERWIVAVTALCGFWNGSAAPLFYELLAEISFPVDEGVSGIILSVGENIGALFFYQVVSRFYTGESMTIAYSFGMVLAVILAAAVREQYKRSYHACPEVFGESLRAVTEPPSRLASP